MKIRKSSVIPRGNARTRRLAVELHLEDTANVNVSRQAVQSLAEAFSFFREEVLDCPAWRRLTRSKKDVPAAAVVEVLAVMVQRYCHWPVQFCSWRVGTKTPSAAGLEGSQLDALAIYETGSGAVGLEAGKVAVALGEAIAGGASSDELRGIYSKQVRLFQKKTNRETPALDTLQIAQAARKRGIPWSVVHRSQYLRLGTGRYSHVLKGSETTSTSSINRAMSRNKRLTNSILSSAGLPVPRLRIARSEQSAIKHARKLGFPLVVKPLAGNMGNGVTIGVQDKARLLGAFRAAQEISRDVVLETLIPGKDFRLLVINGRFVAAAHRQPAQVFADGKSTVREMIQSDNARPERELILTGRMAMMKPLKLDDKALQILADQNLTPDSTPEEGRVIYLCRVPNTSRGGESFDVTQMVHPSIRSLAEQASSAVGLDVCGIDFITADIAKDFRKTGGAICELNSRPGLGLHLRVAGRHKSQITGAFLDLLFPAGRPARLPIVALLGRPSQTQRFRQEIEAVAARANVPIGLVFSDGNSKPAFKASRPVIDAEALLQDNQVDAAVIEADPGQFDRGGIGFEHADLAVLSPPDGSKSYDGAVAALTRITGGRVCRLDDPKSLARSLEALKLPTDSVARFPRVIGQPAAPVNQGSEREFSALFVGDVGFGEPYVERASASDPHHILRMQEPGYSLGGLHDVLGLADLVIANLEVPLTAQPDAALNGRKKWLGWCDCQHTLTALQTAGISAVSLANNHALDGGTKGLAETVVRLRDAGIAGFGAGADTGTAMRPFIHRFSVGGMERSLVVFGGFEYRPSYQRSYGWYADRRIAGVAPLKPELIAPQIDKLRGTLPRPVFVAFPHWGLDYSGVTGQQRASAEALANAGLDLIVGHGTHSLQPADFVNGCPVIYNIGNFVWNTPGRFRQYNAPPFGLAAALSFEGNQRRTAVVRLYPIVTDNSVTEFQNHPVTAGQFAKAARLVSGGHPGRFGGGQDKAGYYLELRLCDRSSAPQTYVTGEQVVK